MAAGSSYFAFAQGHHADLAGNHMDTETRSVREDRGISMEVDGVSRKQVTPDKTPYRLYYYTDGYANELDAGMYTGNITTMPEYTVGSLFNYEPLTTGFPADPGKNQIIPNTHPAYGWWFKAQPLQKGETRKMRIDQAVTSEIYVKE